MTEQNDREILVTRLVGAPRSLVFAAWTEPEHVARWFGPRASSITVSEMEVRPGGSLRMTWRGVDGAESPVRLTYREVVAPERLVYSDYWEMEGATHEALVTVTFAEQDGKTLLTIRTRFESAEMRNGVVELGFEGGWVEFLNRMEEHLATA